MVSRYEQDFIVLTLPKMFLLIDSTIEFCFQQHLSQQPFPVQKFFVHLFFMSKKKIILEVRKFNVIRNCVLGNI